MDLHETYDRLRRLNQETFDAREYAMAYHILEAAMHCAYRLKDAARLTDVGQLARAQGAALDANDPGHRLSSHGALARGTQPLFLSCAQTSAALLAGLRAEQAQGTLRQLARDAGN